MSKKPVTRAERVEVLYDEQRWMLLKDLRCKAVRIMEALNLFHQHSIVHGSIARGDVSKKSDVDVFLPDPPSSFLIETALERADISINRRFIVQATPSHAVKGYIEIDKRQCISFPLARLRPFERGFYNFGGKISLADLKKGKRVLGVDKRLMLIEPISTGHIETAVVGREEAVARLLGAPFETVRDRVRTLLRRNEVGRTGVFIERELIPNETFEEVLKKLTNHKPALRRRLRFS